MFHCLPSYLSEMKERQIQLLWQCPLSQEAEDAKVEEKVKPWMFCLEQTRLNRTKVHQGHTNKMA